VKGMKLQALVNFSYQNRSFKSGQEINIDDEKTSEFLLKSGHAIEASQAQQTSKRGK
jgi:hypothetical protein